MFRDVVDAECEVGSPFSVWDEHTKMRSFLSVGRAVGTAFSFSSKSLYSLSAPLLSVRLECCDPSPPLVGSQRPEAQSLRPSCAVEIRNPRLRKVKTKNMMGLI